MCLSGVAVQKRPGNPRSVSSSGELAISEVLVSDVELLDCCLLNLAAPGVRELNFKPSGFNNFPPRPDRISYLLVLLKSAFGGFQYLFDKISMQKFIADCCVVADHMLSCWILFQPSRLPASQPQQAPAVRRFYK